MTRPVCYTTKTGIKIGCMYQPPAYQPTCSEEFIQGVLLGDSQSLRERRFAKQTFACCILILSVYVGVMWWLS